MESKPGCFLTYLLAFIFVLAPVLPSVGFSAAADEVGILPFNPPALEKAGLQKLWDFKLKAEPKVVRVNVLSKLLIVETAEEILYAFDRMTGEFKWSVLLDDGLAGDVTEDMTSVLASSQSAIHIIDKEQGIAKRIDVPVPISSGPAFAGNQIIVGCYDGTLRAYDTATTFPKWQHRTGARVIGRPVSDGSIVYCAARSGRVYALDVVEGKMIWFFDAKADIVANIAFTIPHLSMLIEEINEDLADNPDEYTQRLEDILFRNFVLAGSMDQNIYCLQRFATGPEPQAEASRQLLWVFNTGGPVSTEPLVGAQTVYVGSESRGVFAINLQSGTQKWFVSEATTPVACGTNRCYAANIGNRNQLLVIGEPDGVVEWKLDVQEFDIVPLNDFDSTIYLVSAYGNIFALREVPE